jgi:hypothetical protein
MDNWFNKSEERVCTEDEAVLVAEDLDNNRISSATAKLHECAFHEDYEQNRAFLAKVKEHEKRGVGSDLKLVGGKQTFALGTGGRGYNDVWTFEIR